MFFKDRNTPDIPDNHTDETFIIPPAFPAEDGTFMDTPPEEPMTFFVPDPDEVAAMQAAAEEAEAAETAEVIPEAQVLASTWAVVPESPSELPSELPSEPRPAPQAEAVKAKEEDEDEEEDDALRLAREIAAAHAARMAAAAAPSAPKAPTASKSAAATPKAPAAPKSAATPKAPAAPPKPPKKRRSFPVFLWDHLTNIIPYRGDPAREWVRKSLFILALLVFVGSLSYILSYEVISPMQTQSTYGNLSDLFYDDPGDNPEQSSESGENSQGGGTHRPPIVKDFTKLLEINDQVQGWLSYAALDMEYPIVYSGENSYYLHHDFYKGWNANGCLFFDRDTPFGSESAYNRVAVIYGHNMNSGLMLAHLNRLYNDVGKMQSASMFNVNTLYEQNAYKVFAVLVIDDSFQDGDDLSAYFNYRRKYFSGNQDFLNFIAEVRARSMYDMPVDVNEGDEIMILSTCTNRSQTKLSDGRLAVFGRKVRAGEAMSVNTGAITLNSDVIMPLQWYTKRGQEPHPYYTDSTYQIETIPTSTTTTTTTTTTEPSVTEPSATTTTTAAEPTTTTTTTTTATEPTEPSAPESSAPESVEPSEPESVEPSEPESAEPSEPESAESSAPESVEPSAPESAEPSAPESVEPSAPESVESSAPVAESASET